MDIVKAILVFSFITLSNVVMLTTRDCPRWPFYKTCVSLDGSLGRSSNDYVFDIIMRK